MTDANDLQAKSTVRATDRPNHATHTDSAGSHPSARDGGLMLLLALLSLAGFIGLTLVVAGGIVIPFDAPLLALGRSWDGSPTIWHLISETANIPLIVIGFVFVAWLFLTRRHREAVLVLLMLAAVTAGSEGVKLLLARPRPAGNGDGIPGVVYSYPSGHVLEALTILGFVAVRSWRSSRPRILRTTVVILVAIEVTLVGIARIALAEHYPSDVLAGVLGGAGVLALYAWLTRSGAWADRTAGDSQTGPVTEKVDT